MNRPVESGLSVVSGGLSAPEERAALDASDAAAERLARRRLTTEERRQQIVDAAAELFDKVGYSSTSMEDIAAVVGVAKPTLYHYFPGKDAVLLEIHEAFIDLLTRQHAERVAAELGPEQLLLEIMADILELMRTHRGHVRVYFEHYRELPPEARAASRIKRDAYHAAVVEIFREGTAKGVFKPVDPELAAKAMFGMCNWAYQWYMDDMPLRPRDIAYRFWSFLVHGVGAAGS
jgi:TetR/AcrR family transcriptional regulator, cholesterol catabolism regulator